MIITINKPVQSNSLQGLFRESVRKMLTVAIEDKVSAFIEQHSSLKTEKDKFAVVRNGHFSECSIQTGLDDIAVNVPKVRDRSGAGIKFNSNLVPLYLKRTKNIE